MIFAQKFLQFGKKVVITCGQIRAKRQRNFTNFPLKLLSELLHQRSGMRTSVIVNKHNATKSRPHHHWQRHWRTLHHPYYTKWNKSVELLLVAFVFISQKLGNPPGIHFSVGQITTKHFTKNYSWNLRKILAQSIHGETSVLLNFFLNYWIEFVSYN